MNEYKLVTDYWAEFTLLVVVIGLLFHLLIPAVVEAIKRLDHREKK